jgi:hypothetical protein
LWPTFDAETALNLNPSTTKHRETGLNSHIFNFPFDN